MTNRAVGLDSSNDNEHLAPRDLAARWRVSTRTLSRWRIAETGPAWLLLNGCVRYRTEDVLGFERARLQEPRRNDL